MKDPKPFRIFRVGTHTDSQGRATTFDRDALEATVKAYNEGEWRAPMVVGHPKDTAPAYGWVDKLRLDKTGDIYVDHVDKMDQQFADMIDGGRFPNRSASWYAPDHPNNPTPGVWQLRHLGWLGAQPPAIKGLGAVNFADGDGTIVEYVDSYTMSSIADLFRRMREAWIAKFGVEEADKALPSFQIQDIQDASKAQTDTPAATAAFSDSTGEHTMLTDEEIKALQAKAATADTLAASKADLESKLTEFKEAQAKREHDILVTACGEALKAAVDAGRILPNQVQPIAEFMAGLDDEAKTFEFGEAASEKLSARGLVLSLLTVAAPKQVEYGELTGASNVDVKMTPTALAAKISEYQASQAKAGRMITTTQACDAVLAGAA